MRRKTALILGIYLTAFLPVRAQGLQHEVVVTANAYPVPFENVARKVTIWTREQILDLPVHSVADLLRYTASIDVRTRGPYGIQSDFSIRGAAFGQALILVNGIPINDSQSGHHNGDIPVALADIERVEILHGPGSSLYGADAFGGTVNIITRNDAEEREAGISGGQFGLLEGYTSWGFRKDDSVHSVAFAANRSSGFMFARDFSSFTLSSESRFGEKSVLFLSHQDKDFGANGFYGPSPSKEWTNATLISLNHFLLSRPRWEVSSRFFYRTHGDHFLWDLRRPGFFENRHRTHAGGGQARARWKVSEDTSLTMGGETGGNWIRSNNLGDHSFTRTAVFAELQHQIKKVVLYPGLRYDYYSNFSSSTSPSLSVGWRLGPGLRLRSSIGRAFRVPTFTELYYRDPNHQARSSLRPETAWGAELGLDWFPDARWGANLTVFSRWESDVIDWVRPTPSEKWRTTNIREIGTEGFEAGVQHILGSLGFLGLQYTYLSSDAGTVDFLSKYVLDFARHSVAGSGSFELPGGLNWGQKANFTQRYDGRSYWLLDARLTKRLGSYRLYLECTNLLNTGYQEIRGVEMPGRWISAGLIFRGW